MIQVLLEPVVVAVVAASVLLEELAPEAVQGLNLLLVVPEPVEVAVVSIFLDWLYKALWFQNKALWFQKLLVILSKHLCRGSNFSHGC